MTPQDKMFFKILFYGAAVAFLGWYLLVRTEEAKAIFNIITPW